MFKSSLLKSYERFIHWARRHDRVKTVFHKRIYSEVDSDGEKYSIRFWIKFYMIGGYGLNPIEEDADKCGIWSKGHIKDADTAHTLYTQEVEKLRRKYPHVWVYVEKRLPYDNYGRKLHLYLENGKNYDAKLDVSTMPPYGILGWF